MTTNHKLTPTAQELVPAIRQKQRIAGRRVFLNTIIIASIVALLGAGIWAFAALTTQDTVQREVGNTNAKNIEDLQEQMKGVCRKVSNPNQLTPEERDGCFRAENSIPPSNVTITEEPKVTVTGLTAREVEELIDQAVAKLPAPITVDQVTAIAATVYSQNKPREVTTDQLKAMVADAVNKVCGDDKCQGPPGIPGKDGENAPAPTQAQIDASVAAFMQTYCSEDPVRCQSTVPGPPGQNGLNGRDGVDGAGISAIRFYKPDVGHCTMRIEYTKPIRPDDPTSTVDEFTFDALTCPTTS